MDFLNIFVDYLEDKVTAGTAENNIRLMLPQLLASGNNRDYARASLCLTYFQRYHQYNTEKIKAKDLLLFIRDFVLYVGRFRFPRLITDVVRREGNSLGVFITMDGEVDVIENIPKVLSEHKGFIHDVYRLGEGVGDGKEYSTGDAYVRRFTRFASYRSLEQKLAVHSAIELPDNNTLMVSLPTGEGKSLITQILAAYEARLTIVIVPTVSLAKDQFLQARDCISDEAVKKNIYCYISGANNSAMITGIKNRTARLVFTSPEAILKNDSFNCELRGAAKEGYLHNVVIDEAHIVPDWGVNFRPDFQIFSVVLKELRKLSEYKIRTYLLSATLSDDVVDVLFGLFGSDGHDVQFRCDALRKEPRYVVVENRSYEKRENDIVEMVKYLPKPMIVYVIEPTTAKRFSKLLKAEGFLNVNTYTGETKDKDRETLLEQWKNNEFDIMIATSAFGMGVDKSNVRTIIHACVPENLSRFYQEVGRAGRDRLPSLSVLTYYTGKEDRRNDLSVAFGLVKGSILTKEKILARFNSILSYDWNIVEGDMVTADLNTVPTTFSRDEADHAGMLNMCWNASTLLLLHRQGYIEINGVKYDAGKQTYLFTFRVNDANLIHDLDCLDKELAVDRQREYDMRVEGYEKMKSVVLGSKDKCWGKHFVSLFPYAQPICSGCPAHPKGSLVREDRIRIRRKSHVEIRPDPPSRALKRHMGVLNNLLIPVDTYEEVDVPLLARKADKLNIACLIYPDDYAGSIAANCMTLKHSEFIATTDKAPWLLRNGMLIVLCDNNGINNKIFEAANKDEMENYRKIWCCKTNMKIISKNRTINDFLDCHVCGIDSL